jgi:DNA-binding MarR family transcriptional regulator
LRESGLQAVGRRVRSQHLTPRQLWVLVRVFEQQGFSLGHQADRLRMGQPTVSRVAATLTLMKRKLLVVKEDPLDRRRTRVLLTRAGSAERTQG